MTIPSIHEQCDKTIAAEYGVSDALSIGIRSAKALKIALAYIEQMKEADRIATEELCARGFDARDYGIRAQ